MWKFATAVACATAGMGAPVVAQNVLFDFDNAPIHRSLPLDLAAGGITAHLSATGENFSIQRADTLGFTPIGFGGLCVYPNSVFRADLLVGFSTTLTDFSILVAMQEYNCDPTGTMRVTAYMDDTSIGTSTATAQEGVWPTTTLAISAPEGFNRVVVHYDKPPPSCGDWGPIFMADNMRVSGAPCVADMDGNGTLNVFDFLTFQTYFNNDDPRADLATPFGVFNVFDFLAFQTSFGNGC